MQLLVFCFHLVRVQKIAPKFLGFNEKVNLEVPAGVQEKAGQFVEAAASTSQKVINTVVDNGSDAYKNVVSRVNQNPTVQAFNDNGDELRQKIDAARERIATQVAKTQKLLVMLQ